MGPAEEHSAMYNDIVRWVVETRKRNNITPTCGEKPQNPLPAWLFRHNCPLCGPAAILLFEQLVPTAEGSGEWVRLGDPITLMAIYQLVKTEESLALTD